MNIHVCIYDAKPLCVSMSLQEIDVLTLGAKDQEQLIADRNKRTIGLLRELFPDITKVRISLFKNIPLQLFIHYLQEVRLG